MNWKPIGDQSTPKTTRKTRQNTKWYHHHEFIR